MTREPRDEFGPDVAEPMPGTITRHRDPNTGETETWAKCHHCEAHIEDWGGEWRHSHTDTVECS